MLTQHWLDPADQQLCEVHTAATKGDLTGLGLILWVLQDEGVAMIGLKCLCEG